MARGIFGDYTLIDDGSIDALASKTQLAINNHTSVICEATFKYNNNICKVDILKRNDDGSYSIYEVKGVTNPYTTALRKTMDRRYIDDIAYQYYVLTNLGINVTSNYLVYLNNEYVYDGHYDLNNLFIIENLTNAILLEFPNDESNIEKINRCINQAEEPESIFASKTYKECPYNKHWYKVKEVSEKNSVLGLYKDKKKYDYLNQGIKSFEDLRKNGIKLKPFNQRMIDSRLDNLPPFIKNNELRYFLNSFNYPLYFFDFETYQNAIP
jgi:hypothetical protein